MGVYQNTGLEDPIAAGALEAKADLQKLKSGDTAKPNIRFYPPNDPVQEAKQDLEKMRSIIAPTSAPGYQPIQEEAAQPTTPEETGQVMTLPRGNYAKGLIEQGNIDLTKRPRVANPAEGPGGYSTVASTSFQDDTGMEILIPMVSNDGRMMDFKEAIAEYYRTGQHLGKFKTPEEATTYAKRLHEDQAKLYGSQQTTAQRYGDVAKAAIAGSSPAAVVEAATKTKPITVESILPGLDTQGPVSAPATFSPEGKLQIPPELAETSPIVPGTNAFGEARAKAQDIAPPEGFGEKLAAGVSGLAPELPGAIAAATLTPGPAPAKVAAAFAIGDAIKNLATGESSLEDVGKSALIGAIVGLIGGTPVPAGKLAGGLTRAAKLGTETAVITKGGAEPGVEPSAEDYAVNAALLAPFQALGPKAGAKPPAVENIKVDKTTRAKRPTGPSEPVDADFIEIRRGGQLEGPQKQLPPPAEPTAVAEVPIPPKGPVAPTTTQRRLTYAKETPPAVKEAGTKEGPQGQAEEGLRLRNVEQGEVATRPELLPPPQPVPTQQPTTLETPRAIEGEGAIKPTTVEQYNANYEGMKDARDKSVEKFESLLRERGIEELRRYASERNVPAGKDAKAEDIIHGLVRVESAALFNGDYVPSVDVVLGAKAEIIPPVTKEISNKKPFTALMYHGGEQAISKIDAGKFGTRTDPGFFGSGFYMTDDMSNAKRWGSQVTEGTVTLNNPLHVSGITDFYNKTGMKQVSSPSMNQKQIQAAYAKEVERVTSELKSKGYDGIVYTRSDGVKQVTVFYPESVAINARGVRKSDTPMLQPSDLQPGKPIIEPEAVAERLGIKFDGEKPMYEGDALKYHWTINDPKSPAYKASFSTEKVDLETMIDEVEAREAKYEKLEGKKAEPAKGQIPTAEMPKPKKRPEGPAKASYWQFDPEKIFDAAKKLKPKTKAAIDRLKASEKRRKGVERQRALTVFKKSGLQGNKLLFSPSYNNENLLSRIPDTMPILHAFENQRGASSIIDDIVRHVDRKAYLTHTPSSNKALDKYTSWRRSAELAEQGRLEHAEPGLKVEDYQEFIDSLSDKERAKLDKRYAHIREAWDKIFDYVVREDYGGMLTKEQERAVRSRGEQYSPREYIEDLEKDITFGRAFEGGKDAFLSQDQRFEIQNVGTRVIHRVLSNRANVRLWGFASANPKLAEQFGFRALKPLEPIKDKPGRYKWPDVGENEEMIKGLLGGDQRAVAVPKEFYREWYNIEPWISQQAIEWWSWASGAKALKMGATGALRPFFFLRNLPADIGYTVGLRNPDLFGWDPVRQTSRALVSYIRTFPDALLEKNLYELYISEGGGMNFMSKQGLLSPKAYGIFHELEGGANKLNRVSELMTRLTVMDRVFTLRAKEKGITREQAMKDPAIRTEAVWRARTNIDFGRAGQATRIVEPFAPYTSAMVAGMDGIRRGIRDDAYRNARKKGRETPNWKDYTLRNRVLWSMGTVLSASVLYGLYNRTKHPREYSETSSRDKVNYQVIHTGRSFVDEDGNRRYLFLKLKKDHTIRGIATLGDSVADLLLGEPVDEEALKEGIMQASGLGQTVQVAPTIKAMIALQQNWDIGRGTKVSRDPKIKGAEDYDEYTKTLYKELGKKLDISPAKAQSVMESIFANNDVILVADMLTEMYTTPLSEEENDRTTKQFWEEVQNKPVLRDMVGLTHPRYAEDSLVADVSEAVAYRRLKISRDVDALVQRTVKGIKDGVIKRGLDDTTDLDYLKSLTNPTPSTKGQKPLAEVEAIEDYEYAIDRYQSTLTAEVLGAPKWFREISKQPREVRREVMLGRISRLLKTGDTEDLNTTTETFEKYGQAVDVYVVNERLKALMSKTKEKK